VGAIVPGEFHRRVLPAAFSDTQKQAVVRLLRNASFVGGQDNAPALAYALQQLESEPSATLLWIHGPQPVNFRAGAARLEQATARLTRLPHVVLYSVEPGPNEVLPDAPWGWGARSLPRTHSVQGDLSAYFARLSGDASAHEVHRTKTAVAGLPKGSDHIARLWANDRVIELMRSNPAENRPEAVRLAADYRLVTPVSGAVVLETQQQYDESRLTPPVTQATVPTVPEPHEWALALIASAMLGWLAWRHRQRFATA
jgi:hypothetical protein